MQRNAIPGCRMVAICLALAATSPARAGTLKQVADATFGLWVVRNPILILKYDTETAMPGDGTPAAAAALARHAGQLQAQLARLPAPGTPNDLLLRDQVARVLENLHDTSLDYWDSFTIDAYGSQLLDMQDLLDNYPLRTAAQRQHFLALVALVGRIADGQVEKRKGQAARHIPLPQSIADSGAAAWRALATIPVMPEQHPLVPDPLRLAGVSEAEAAAFSTDLARLLRTEVAPAAERLVVALDRARPDARQSVGLADVPGWRAAYERRVRSEIGAGVTPQTLHDLGLSEIRRLTIEMSRVRAAVGLPADEAAATAALRARPGLVAQKPEDWQQRFDAALACIRPKLGQVFADLPTAPARAERLSPALEATMTYGWALTPTPERPYTVYQYNGTPGRIMNGAADLIFHELYPGHHFQYATGLLNPRLHPLQTEYVSSLYSEGWAQYATVVARERGCLEDPADQLGSLQAQRQLAARLVLDTGLNALRWSEDRARAFARDEARMAAGEIDSELVRFGARLPAQALGYHYGMVVLLRERARASAALGDRFDIRAWHHAMLSNGDLSATMIHTLTDQVIADGRPALAAAAHANGPVTPAIAAEPAQIDQVRR